LPFFAISHWGRAGSGFKMAFWQPSHLIFAALLGNLNSLYQAVSGRMPFSW
jgi:hypothetical protein